MPSPCCRTKPPLTARKGPLDPPLGHEAVAVANVPEATALTTLGLLRLAAQASPAPSASTVNASRQAVSRMGLCMVTAGYEHRCGR